MEQQEKENNDNDAGPKNSDNRLDRMWKSHPWQSDVSGKPSLGPPPSASRAKWGAPWRKKFNPDAMPPPLTDDDISLGESLGEDSTIMSVDNNDVPEEKITFAPKIVPAPIKTPVPVPPTPVNTPEKAPVPLSDVVKPKKSKAAPKAVIAREPIKAEMSHIKSSKEEKVAAAVPPPPPATVAKAPIPAGPTEQEIAEENAELLAIDFDRDGDALRDAISEDVLAMWQDQGLYQDMPEIRDELLKGIVDQKFQALKDEQAKVLEEKQLAGMPKLADQHMAVITEEEEEEETSDYYDDEDIAAAVNPPVLEEQKTITSHDGTDCPSLEDQEPNMTTEERIALHAFQVQEELESRLQNMDTSEHECVEASGRLGNLSESEKEKLAAIKDYHAFNKFKLRDAVEKRVSQIFTEDHHVVTNLEDEDNEEEIVDAGMDGSSASLPVNSSNEKKASVANVRHSLSASFSVFDALLSKKPTVPAGEEDEWTEYVEEDTVAEDVAKPAAEVKPEDIKKLVADMDRKLGLVPGHQASEEDDQSFMEYTVRDEIDEYTVDELEVDVDELSDMRSRGDSEVDIDELSAQREKERGEKENTAQKAMPHITRPQGKRTVSRVVSTESSFVEMTVADGAEDNARTPQKSNTRDAETKLSPQQAFNKQTPMTSLGGKFPTITMTTLDDDELTQITFDHTVEGPSSADKPKAFSPSAPKCSSGGSQETNKTRDTCPLDEASYSRHSRSSLDSNSRDAAAAMSKSVAKILRVDIWSTKGRVVQAAMEKLALAAAQGSYQRSNIVRLGGAIAILRAMQSHPTHLQIQRSSCTALAHLSVDEDTQEAIAEVGGTGAIVTAMESHPADHEVVEAACVALANITSPRGDQEEFSGMSDDSDEDDDGRAPGAGVVQALVTAMNKHPLNTEIQARAFIALSNLCLDNRERLSELSEAGGLTSMTMALQRPWENKMEQHEAISTLSILLRSLAELGTSHC